MPASTAATASSHSPETSAVPSGAQILARQGPSSLQDFERERHRQFMSFLAPAFAAIHIILFLFGLPSLFIPGQPAIHMLRVVLSGALALLFAFETYVIFKGYIRLAVRLHLTLGNAGTMAVVLLAILQGEALQNGSQVAGPGIDPSGILQFTALLVLIVVSGVLGNVWVIVATTLVMNAFTGALLVLAPTLGHIEEDIRDQLSGIVATLIAYQWVFALITTGVWLTYRQTFRSLNSAYEHVRQLDSLKDQFITNVNHELRTPMMTIQTYIEDLRLTRHLMSNEEEGAILEKVSRTGGSMVTLLSSILDARRMAQKVESFTPEALSLRSAFETATQLIDPHEGRIGERTLRVSIPADIMVWGEPTWVQQILMNLVSNAMKYSPADAPIEIGARVTEATSGTRSLFSGRVHAPMVEFTVRDYGLGIPPQQIPLLFNRFVRLPRDLASTVVGNGLGLYLCRAMAEAMGGRIWVESAGIEGQGSIFYVHLPVPTPSLAPSLATLSG